MGFSRLCPGDVYEVQQYIINNKQYIIICLCLLLGMFPLRTARLASLASRFFLTANRGPAPEKCGLLK